MSVLSLQDPVVGGKLAHIFYALADTTSLPVVTFSAGFATPTMQVKSYSIVKVAGSLQCTIYCQPAAAANSNADDFVVTVALPAGVKENVFSATTQGAGSIQILQHLAGGTEKAKNWDITAVTTGRTLATAAIPDALTSGDTYQFVIQLACAV